MISNSGNNSPSLRLRTTTVGNTKVKEISNEIQLCPSVMSEEVKKMLPPTSETVMTKPFPIRGMF